VRDVRDLEGAWIDSRDAQCSLARRHRVLAETVADVVQVTRDAWGSVGAVGGLVRDENLVVQAAAMLLPDKWFTALG
jgi:hypothetical protein